MEPTSFLRHRPEKPRRCERQRPVTELTGVLNVVRPTTQPASQTEAKEALTLNYARNAKLMTQGVLSVLEHIK